MTTLLAQASAVSCAESGFLLLIMFGVFWFMYLRPQQKEQQKLKSWMAGLKKGDEVVAQGFIGRVHEVAADHLVLDLGRDVRVRVLKSKVEGPYKEQKEEKAPEKPAEEAKK
jgi:preprotein translocase subunit YajC